MWREAPCGDRAPTRRSRGEIVPTCRQVIVPDRQRWTRLLAAAGAEPSSSPRRISELCVDRLGVTGAGVAMVTPVGNRGIVCATDEVAARIEDLQFTLGEGPCIDAVLSGAPVLVGDLDVVDGISLDRWPAFLEGAAAVGVRGVFAFPLRIGATNVGALDLYRDRTGDLDADELAAALMAADAIALALLRYRSDGTLIEDVDPYFTHQLQVHQATGMVQAQLGSTTQEALLALRAHAFVSEHTLVDIATAVVERRLRFPVEDQ